MTPKYHLTCANTPRPKGFAELADKMSVKHATPTLLELIDTVIRTTAEYDTHRLLNQARALIAP